MTEQFYSQFSDDMRRTRYDNDDLDRELDRRRQERGTRQARPGQPWYDEPQRQRYQEYQDQEDEGRWVPIRRTGRQRDEWRQVSGPYAGIGPSGYRRSDENIKDDICSLLTRHGQIDARNIEIQVEDGEATLTGMVSDRRAKRLAEDLVESISCVRDVHNRLRLI